MNAAAINNGGQAFPIPGAEYTEDCGDFKRDAYHGPQQGMTLRDYFAAKALHSMVAALSSVPAFNTACSREAGDCEVPLEDYVAARAYDWADAMLKAR